MKKIFAAALILAAPMLANAIDVNINMGPTAVRTPAGTITFGSRDTRGYYWDGGMWREPAYWNQHGGPRGEKYYTGRGNGVPHQGGGFCPPGQAKKGRC